MTFEASVQIVDEMPWRSCVKAVSGALCLFLIDINLTTAEARLPLPIIIALFI